MECNSASLLLVLFLFLPVFLTQVVAVLTCPSNFSAVIVNGQRQCIECVEICIRSDLNTTCVCKNFSVENKNRQFNLMAYGGFIGMGCQAVLFIGIVTLYCRCKRRTDNTTKKENEIKAGIRSLEEKKLNDVEEGLEKVKTLVQAKLARDAQNELDRILRYVKEPTLVESPQKKKGKPNQKKIHMYENMSSIHRNGNFIDRISKRLSQFVNGNTFTVFNDRSATHTDIDIETNKNNSDEEPCSLTENDLQLYKGQKAEQSNLTDLKTDFLKENQAHEAESKRRRHDMIGTIECHHKPVKTLRSHANNTVEYNKNSLTNRKEVASIQQSHNATQTLPKHNLSAKPSNSDQSKHVYENTVMTVLKNPHAENRISGTSSTNSDNSTNSYESCNSELSEHNVAKCNSSETNVTGVTNVAIKNSQVHINVMCQSHN